MRLTSAPGLDRSTSRRRPARPHRRWARPCRRSGRPRSRCPRPRGRAGPACPRPAARRRAWNVVGRASCRSSGLRGELTGSRRCWRRYGRLCGRFAPAGPRRTRNGSPAHHAQDAQRLGWKRSSIRNARTDGCSHGDQAASPPSCVSTTAALAPARRRRAFACPGDVTGRLRLPLVCLTRPRWRRLVDNEPPPARDGRRLRPGIGRLALARGVRSPFGSSGSANSRPSAARGRSVPLRGSRGRAVVARAGGFALPRPRSARVPSVRPSWASSPAAWTAVPTRSVPLGGLGGRLGGGCVPGGLRGGGGPDPGGLGARTPRGGSRDGLALAAAAAGLAAAARLDLAVAGAATRAPPAGALGTRAGEGRHDVAALAQVVPVAGVWLIGAHHRDMIAHSARRRRPRLTQQMDGCRDHSVRAVARSVAQISCRNLKRIRCVTRSTSGAPRIGRGGSQQKAGLCRERR